MELVKQILIYSLIVSVLRGLITNEKYKQYFQFFSGTILILIFVTQIFSYMGKEGSLYNLFKEKVYDVDLNDIKKQMKISDGKFEGIVVEKYKTIAKKQIETMAQEEGIRLKDTEIIVEKYKGQWRVKDIEARIDNSEENIAIETISIGKSDKIEADSKDVIKLKNDICKYYSIGRKKVHVWK